MFAVLEEDYHKSEVWSDETEMKCFDNTTLHGWLE